MGVLSKVFKVKYSRIGLEKKNIAIMIGMYCVKHHNTEKGQFCNECLALSDYALKRLDKCTFGESKGNCSDCKIHCYRPDMRTKIRAVMRYSGPRMHFKTPMLALMHTVSSLCNKKNNWKRETKKD